VMYGTSPVDQKTFDTLVPQLVGVKGKHFLSMEPQLANIYLGDASGIDWIIQGGESGHHKRPFDLEWARSMRFQCSERSIPYFFKQIDKVQAIPEDLLIREFPNIVVCG
jgi:protein gp37